MVALEQVDVLGFLAGEVEQRADAPVVIQQMRPGMIEHEGEDELLDHAEDAQILVRGNLVQQSAARTAFRLAIAPVRARLSGMKLREKSRS